jgi:hypothetical protein
LGYADQKIGSIARLCHERLNIASIQDEGIKPGRGEKATFAVAA